MEENMRKQKAAGLYLFPWLEQGDPDSMEAYLKKDNGQWMNLLSP